MRDKGVGLLACWYRSWTMGWRRVGMRFELMWNPWEALHIAVVKVRTNSGMTLELELALRSFNLPCAALI